MQAEIVERARRGDREAFGVLVAGEIERLLVIARLVLRDQDLAEDAVQEALVRCWRQLPKLRELDRFDRWIYRILMRTAADELARHRRHETAVTNLSAEPAVADEARAIADRDQLERGFRRLSVDHRAVIVLHHYVGLPLSEVASTLGVPAGTVKSRYHYAMAALRASLEADGRRAIAEALT
jgi:RNA polymerase sigma factor (sigma-70 family)